VRAGLARRRQREHDVGRSPERAVAHGSDGDQPDAEAARIVDQVLELDGLARPRQRHDDVVGRDHAEIAVACLARMHEEGGRAGRGERRRDLAPDMPGLAHPGHDHAAARARDQLHRVDEGAAEAVVDGMRERGDAARRKLERAHRRGDQVALACVRCSLGGQRLGHRCTDKMWSGAGAPRMAGDVTAGARSNAKPDHVCRGG
jgi:hypothetical protein